jgi:RNA polymerase sigma-70 factor (ECF subfamily)
MRAQAEQVLRHASGLAALGAYQMEAAIQSAHCARRLGMQVPPEALVALYDALLALRPSTGARVSRACAVGVAAGAAAGLKALDEIPVAEVASYQPYWAARAHLLGGAGNGLLARDAYARAMGLSSNPVVRAYLAAASDRL